MSRRTTALVSSNTSDSIAPDTSARTSLAVTGSPFAHAASFPSSFSMRSVSPPTAEASVSSASGRSVTAASFARAAIQRTTSGGSSRSYRSTVPPALSTRSRSAISAGAAGFVLRARVRFERMGSGATSTSAASSGKRSTTSVRASASACSTRTTRRSSGAAKSPWDCPAMTISSGSALRASIRTSPNAVDVGVSSRDARSPRVGVEPARSALINSPARSRIRNESSPWSR